MKTAVLFFILLLALDSVSQTLNAKPMGTYHRSQLFGEAAGTGVGLSLHYESMYWRGKNGIGFSAGGGLCPFIDAAAITIPFGLDYVYGNKYGFELGFGSTPLIFTGEYASDSEWMLYFLGGYRQSLLDGDLIGRIFFSPFLAKEGSILASNLDVKGKFIPYGGVSLGILLKKKSRTNRHT
jgi:hypothetical protein